MHILIGLDIFYNYYHYAVAGLGFSISLPLSSQSILKSNRTSLVLFTMMLVCTTLLCTPARNNPTMARLERENQGCSHRDVRKDTWAVAGSPNQYTAPTATHT